MGPHGGADFVARRLRPYLRSVIRLFRPCELFARTLSGARFPATKWYPFLRLKRHRIFCFVVLLVATFMAATGQLRPTEACASAPFTSGSVLDSSAFDDEFGVLPDGHPPEGARSLSRLPPSLSVIPCSRLVVLDLFRPPMVTFV